MDDPYLIRSAEAARLAGVGQTAIKRWADTGLLPCVRTAGGHRRFRREDVERLSRSLSPASSTTDWDGWLDVLVSRPNVHAVTARLFDERARRGSWHHAMVIVGALLTEIGLRWADGRLSILEEHLASGLLQRALATIADTMPVPADAPVCLLATPEGNDHTVGLSLVEVCLREAGWRAEWAGMRTPAAEIVFRVERGGLGMVALSAAANASDADLLASIAARVGDACQASGAEFVIGGGGAWPDAPVYGTRLHDLSAFFGLAVRTASERS